MRNIRKVIDGVGTWWRDTEGNPVRSSGPDDQTPGHSGYDSRCGMCWLGYGHTQDYHAIAIEFTSADIHPDEGLSRRC